ATVLDHAGAGAVIEQRAAMQRKLDRLARRQMDGDALARPAGEQCLRGGARGGGGAHAGGVAGAHAATGAHDLHLTVGVHARTPFAGSGRASRSSAFVAAAASGEPPRVPRSVTNGRSRVNSSSFDSAAATKPTGMPTISAGRTSPASHRSSSASNAVGALPIAQTAPLSRGASSRTASTARGSPDV